METRREALIQELSKYTNKEGVAFLSHEDAVDYYRGLIEVLENSPPLCTCDNVDFGSYERTVTMIAPFELPHRNDKLVAIDICIARDLAELWKEGVKTTGSCCGHNKLPPTVTVEEISVQAMEVLGYQHYEQCPFPKTTFLL